MTYALEAQRIQARFKTQWASAQPTIKVDYGESGFEAPSNSAWVELTVQPNDATNAALGHEVRNFGAIIIRVFVPHALGARLARQLMDSATPIFNNARFNGIRCWASVPTWLGLGDLGRYQATIRTPYYWHTIT